MRAIVGADVVVADAGALHVLVESAAGYTNLCRLLTAGALGRAKGHGRVTWEQVEAHATGLFCLAGGDDGPLVERATAAARLDRLRGIFAERLAVDVHHHRERAGARTARWLADLPEAHG